MNLDQPAVYIIVPVHRTVAQTRAFLSCVRQHVPNAAVVVVDDDEAGSCANAFHGERGVVILPGNGSLWWGGAINRGIDWLAASARPAEDDLIVFANNDVTFDGPLLADLAAHIGNRRIVHPDVADTRGRPIGAGRRLVSWFPYVTRLPRCHGRATARVDLATARFLSMRWSTLREIGKIHPLLPHYQGDNEFSLRARRRGITTVQVFSVRCTVDESSTGAKNSNLLSIGAFFRSLTSIRSANNLLYRYRFASANVGRVAAVPVLASMTANSILKTLLNMAREAVTRIIA